MFKKISLFLLIMSLFLMLGGCSSKLYVRDISPVAQPKVDVKPTIAKPTIAIPVVRTIKPIPVKFTLKGKVLFDHDSYKIDAKAEIILKGIVAQIKKHPDTLLVLKGHTDKTGTNEYNKILSKNRADSVRNYLVNLGVSAKKIVGIESFGETQLLPEMTAHENRRVIILSVEWPSKLQIRLDFGS